MTVRAAIAGLFLLALGLAACGGGGTSSGSTTARAGREQSRSDPRDAPSPHAHENDPAHRHPARTRRDRHRARRANQAAVSKACADPTQCTLAARKAGTFWPTKARPHRTSEGAVTYAAPSGELLPPAPGEMAISSPAFALNEALPAAYTCDGAGISPPLEWRNVPAKAAALVLLVIDASSDGREGGIRWMVADIDPHDTGVAAGAVPAGGVVGRNAEGKPGYGPVCPPRGKESWVEFQLYALSEPISVSPGFEPGEAESAYAGHILGSGAATTYAVYVRP